MMSPGLRQHFAEHRKQAQEAKAEMHAILKAGGSRRSRWSGGIKIDPRASRALYIGTSISSHYSKRKKK